jgi:hypothetical protein
MQTRHSLTRRHHLACRAIRSRICTPLMGEVRPWPSCSPVSLERRLRGGENLVVGQATWQGTPLGPRTQRFDRKEGRCIGSKLFPKMSFEKENGAW